MPVMPVDPAILMFGLWAIGVLTTYAAIHLH